MDSLPPVAAAAQAYVARTMAAAGDPGVALVVVRADGRAWCRGFGTTVAGTRVSCETPFAIEPPPVTIAA